MKTTTLRLRNLLNRSPLSALLLIPFVLACFAFAPQAQATCQEGCDITNGNTFLGDDALISNTTGMWNTATGDQALYANTLGAGNTATGNAALYANTTGSYNTATGLAALQNNTTGTWNTATGWEALFHNTTGSWNTATGNGTLVANTSGSYNTAIGLDALFYNTTGGKNTAIGTGALSLNATGNSNTAIGLAALLRSTGSFNTVLGDSAGANLTTGSHNIDIGNDGRAGDSNTIRIGTTQSQTKTYIAGISGVTVAGGVGVIIDANGQLGTIVSSERFKNEVKPMDKASEAILALKPVTFRYKHDLDPAGIPQFGLIAEQVEKVNPDLVARDEQGKPYTVRYEAVNAMLLNEFLKEHKKVEQLQATVAQQQKDFLAAIATLRQTVTAQLNAQAAQMQKLSAKLETSKPFLQTIADNH